MSHTYGMSCRDQEALALHNFAGQACHTVGLLLLLLVMGRLAWRQSGITPKFLLHSFRWPQAVSKLLHAGSYCVLFLIPLSGWVASSAYRGAPIWFFNIKGLVPPLLPEVPLKEPFAYGFFAHLHVWSPGRRERTPPASF